MSVDPKAILEVVQLYHTRRAELIELRRRGESTNFLAKCKQLFDFIEGRQDGLAYLIEAAMDLAGAYGEIGDWSSAEPIFEKCVAVRRAACGPRHANTATALMMLGVAKFGLHKYAEAEALLLECIDIRAEVVGESHPHFALALMNLAAVYEATDRKPGRGEQTENERVALHVGSFARSTRIARAIGPWPGAIGATRSRPTTPRRSARGTRPRSSGRWACCSS